MLQPPKNGGQHQITSQPYHVPGRGAFDNISQMKNIGYSWYFLLSFGLKSVG